VDCGAQSKRGGINTAAFLADYELLPETSESMIYTVMIRLLLKRLTQSQTDAS